MSQIVAAINSPLAWEQVYSESREGYPLSENSYYPIPSYNVPIIFDSFLLMVGTSSQYARAHWKLGCWLTQVIDVPLADFDEIKLRKYFVPVNDATLIRFASIAPQYRLRVDVPWWMRELRLTIYEYQGTLDDSTEALIRSDSELIRTDILRVESKVDQL